jgi:Holliday junction resolvasome RuvABC endonuclease subunit
MRTAASNNRILGVDPGVHGGLAIIANDGNVPQVIAAIDVPLVGVKAKERVDVIALQEWLLQHGPDLALIERAQSMPRQGSSSTFKYARAVGAIETAIMLCGIPIEIIEASGWKRHFQLHGGDKEGARQRALLMFPSAHDLLARRRDHNRAEALLIAVFSSVRAGRIAA